MYRNILLTVNDDIMGYQSSSTDADERGFFFRFTVYVYLVASQHYYFFIYMFGS